MKTLLLLLALNVFAREDGLPFEPDTTKVRLSPIAVGQDLQLQFSLKLPPSQKLNPGAPSEVAVFERIPPAKWKETAKFDLKNFVLLGDTMNFSKKVQLASASSEVAVFSTIFHCGKDGRRCYIQGFEGKASRSSSASASVSFNIQGSMK